MPGIARASGGGSRRRTCVASLSASALCAAALAGRWWRNHANADALHSRALAAGGLGHGVGFRALVGALDLAGLRTGELLRPLTVAGLDSAAGLLAPLYFVSESAAWFIPAGWCYGLPVSGIAGASTVDVRADFREAVAGTRSRGPGDRKNPCREDALPCRCQT